MSFAGIRTISKLAALAVIGFGLSACASGAESSAMISGQVGGAYATPQIYKETIAVGTVDGGSDTYKLWKSNVSTENFKDALAQSLKANLMLSPSAGRYTLDAHILDIDQPVLGGFSMTVTASVHYKMVETTSQKTVFDDKIVTPYTAGMSDHVLGYERLRLANEGAVRENIKALIAKLQALK